MAKINYKKIGMTIVASAAVYAASEGLVLGMDVGALRKEVGGLIRMVMKVAPAAISSATQSTRDASKSDRDRFHRNGNGYIDLFANNYSGRNMRGPQTSSLGFMRHGSHPCYRG